MRILILTQFYPPEVGAAQNRLSGWARRLVKFGHEVEVLTAMPNYPRGRIFEGYQRRLLVEEELDGVRVIRSWILARGNQGFLQRLLGYFSFVLSSLFVGAWKTHTPDVIVVESPPLFLGISALILRFIHGSKLELNVSDLWPESAVAMGIVRNRLAIALSKRLEEFLYHQADLITGQTQGIVANIRSRCPEKKVALFVNGADTECFAAVPATTTQLKEQWGFGGSFVVGYTGLHGFAQGLETVLAAAALLQHHRDLLFVFFGDGPEKDHLQNLARSAGLTNVRFFPIQPRSEMPRVLSALDVAVVPLRRLPLFRGALPSKMFEAMAARVPIVVSVDGEARSLVEAAGAGICVEPENPKHMAEALLQLYQAPQHRVALGENGQRYVFRYCNRDDIVRKFADDLVGLYSLPGKGLNRATASASRHPF